MGRDPHHPHQSRMACAGESTQDGRGHASHAHGARYRSEGKTMLMPTGKYAGQPVKELGTAFLAWTLSQDAIRHARPALIEHIVGVLAERFRDSETLLAELRVAEPPPARWRSAKNAATKKARLRKAQDPYDASDLV